MKWFHFISVPSTRQEITILHLSCQIFYRIGPVWWSSQLEPHSANAIIVHSSEKISWLNSQTPCNWQWRHYLNRIWKAKWFSRIKEQSLETTAVGFEARAEIENAISRKNPVHRFQNFVTIETESKMRKKAASSFRTPSTLTSSSTRLSTTTTTTTSTDFRSKVKRALHGTILKSARRCRAPARESQS